MISTLNTLLWPLENINEAPGFLEKIFDKTEISVSGVPFGHTSISNKESHMGKGMLFPLLV